MTLLLSVALAATLGVLVYFSVTSLPYLAASPSSDPTFGEINGCLLHAVPDSRVGFAVSPDARAAAAWSNALIAKCIGPTAQVWPIAGVTAAAFDRAGRLWAAIGAADAGVARMLVLDGPEPRALGDVSPAHLVGVETGVVALEASGRLISLKADGSIVGLVDLKPGSASMLSASGDGRRVAITTSGGLYVLTSDALRTIRAEAPCDVEFVWWLRGHRALLSCGPKASWALWLDVDTGLQDTAAPRVRSRSVLAGPDGPWVQPCDVLPCTAVEP